MLYQGQNVTNSMHTLATYMTTALRANDTRPLQQSENATFQIAPTQVVIGKVWIQEQIVIVRWGYLFLPGFLLVLAVILVVAVYTETRNFQVGLWNSSPLVLSFHGQFQKGSPHVDWNLDLLSTEKGMKKVASGLWA